MKYTLLFNDGLVLISVNKETLTQAKQYFVDSLYEIFAKMDPNAEYTNKERISEMIDNDYVIESEN